MGYSTDFYGWFEVKPEPLEQDMVRYLQAFAMTRRMTWDTRFFDLEGYDDPLRTRLGIPLGRRGDHFVGHLEWDGNRAYNDPAIVDSNVPPGKLLHRPDGSIRYVPYADAKRIQPGLWCQWTPTDDGKHIEWDGVEKFYHWNLWLHYLLDNYLYQFGRWVEGEVTWIGEDRSDRGTFVALPVLGQDRSYLSMHYE